MEGPGSYLQGLNQSDERWAGEWEVVDSKAVGNKECWQIFRGLVPNLPLSTGPKVWCRAMASEKLPQIIHPFAVTL